LKLGEGGTKADLPPLMQAWTAEQDECTRSLMFLALQRLVSNLSYDVSQHPGHQEWLTPFQACAAPERPMVSLTLEQVTGPTITIPTVRISGRNQTQRVLPFVGASSPEQLFSVTVLDPSGAPAKSIKGRESMYEPWSHNLGGGFGRAPIWVPLPPGEEVAMGMWKVGDDFDLSAPGTYRVSLGARIGYLDTTVCSNTVEVKVGN
jgi:hypothetical protein